MFCLYTLPLARPAQAKVQMLTTSSCIVKLIPSKIRVIFNNFANYYFTGKPIELPSKYSIDEDSNSEGGVQSPPDCNLLLAPPTPPASHALFESPSHAHLLQNNDVIKSESHDNIFSTKPKSVHSSELKRRASDVGVVAPPNIGSSPPPLLSNSSSSSSNQSTSVSSNNNTVRPRY